MGGKRAGVILTGGLVSEHVLVEPDVHLQRRELRDESLEAEEVRKADHQQPARRERLDEVVKRPSRIVQMLEHGPAED